MKIEIAREGRMDMSGRGLIRAIQNNNMPLLDLLVRESVQNSLDAARKGSERVNVEFGTGEFCSSRLSPHFEGISRKLDRKYGNGSSSFFYVRDSETYGLNGPMHFSLKNESGQKNLLKLVYEIAKPQEGKGAGGSWGYGKTIYFRVGIGLVIYYSRIMTEDGNYQSRLAACLVEDEKKEDALLSDPSLNSHRGLAWWGREFHYESNGTAETGTVPETDESEIAEILDIFGISPFTGEKTGTAIIIPYINEEQLLQNNISKDSGGKVRLRWLDSVEEYLKIAVQRWYPGRLNNPVYQKIQRQPWLAVTINKKPLQNDDMERTFLEIRSLYNMALRGEPSHEDFHCEPIKVRNYLEEQIAGHVAYKMYTPRELDMLPPDNNPSPFYFIKNEDGADDYKDGDIIFTYFRKPGMAISYETSGEWVNKIKLNNERSGSVLLAVFVLNSSNRFRKSDIMDVETIEEYFRASERADHTSWYDINANGSNPRILSKLQQSVRKKINESFKVKEEQCEEKNSSLSRMFGDVFLPPKGFGRKASGKTVTKKKNADVVKHKNISMTVRKNRIKHITEKGQMIMPVAIDISHATGAVEFILEVAADGRNISLAKWSETLGIRAPFVISAVRVRAVHDNVTLLDNAVIKRSDPAVETDELVCRMIMNNAGECYGVSILSDRRNLHVELDVGLHIYDYMAEMTYKLKAGESDE